MATLRPRRGEETIFPNSVLPEAARRLRVLQFGQIKIADRAQGIRRRAAGKARGHLIKPRLIIGLQLDQLGDGIAPALRPAAPVGNGLRPRSWPRPIPSSNVII
jgi:hypothetical protein